MTDTITADVKVGFNPKVSELLNAFELIIDDEDPTPQELVDLLFTASAIANSMGMELFSQLQVVQSANQYIDRIL